MLIQRLPLSPKTFYLYLLVLLGKVLIFETRNSYQRENKFESGSITSLMKLNFWLQQERSKNKKVTIMIQGTMSYKSSMKKISFFV